MKYANDRINVHGDFCTCSTMSSTVSASSSYNYYYQGTLAIDGNLYQYNGANGQTKNFYCCDGFTVEFVGSGTHELYFENLASGITNLKVPDDAKIKFTNKFKGFKMIQDLTIEGDCQIDSGTMNLNDHTLTVEGNLTQIGGVMYPNGGILNVNGNYRVDAKTHLDNNNSVVTDSSGSIHMKYANDRINVHGDFCTYSTMSSTISSSYNYYYQGTLAIDGNLYQYNGANGQTKNFYCYDGFTVEFVGSGTHTINSESSNTKLMNIKLVKGATISFNGSLNGFDDLSGLDFSVADSTIAKADNAYIKGKGIGDTNLYIQNDTKKSTIKVYVEEGVEETEKAGDINGDGKTTVADAILLLNWLLNSSELSTSDLQNADLCEDGVINVLDLCAMKRMLLSQE